MRREHGWLRALHESGELAREAAAVSSWPALSCDGWVVEPDADVTCRRCLR